MNVEKEKLKQKLKGVIALLVTPFNKDLEVDFEGLRQNVSYLIEKGVSGLIPNGSTGEFASLTLEEQKKVIKTVVDEANGKALVIPGVSHTCFKVTLELAKYAENVGADAVMIVPPYYFVGSDEGIYQYYKTISENINIGIMIYNNPHTSKICLSIDLLSRLSELENVVALKEVSGNTKYFISVIEALRNKIAVIPTAESPQTILGYMYGAQPALITLEVNPQASRKFLEKAAIERNYEEARAIYESDFKLFNNLYERLMAKGIPGYIPYAKAALDILGRCGGRVRPPLTDLTISQRQELENVLRKIGWL